MPEQTQAPPDADHEDLIEEVVAWGASPMTRRRFLGVTLTIAALAAACQSAAETTPRPNSPLPIPVQYPEVPYPPAVPPSPNTLAFFSPHEMLTVDAIIARILPGTADDPGAREADVANFIDKALAFNEGYNEPTYHQAPFAQKTEPGKEPPGPAPDKSVIYVLKDELERYGYQAKMTPREIYRAGLAEVDAYAHTKFSKDFVDLTEDQQDTIVGDMADDKATGFDKPSAKDFFDRLQTDTVNGLFADPAYGGNRDMVGWKLIGYPGAQRAYTPIDLHTEGNVRPPQSLAMLHNFHPGQPANADVIVPSSGPDQNSYKPNNGGR